MRRSSQIFQLNLLGSMISNWLSAALARRNIHYGWVMVGVTFLTALIAPAPSARPACSSCRCRRNSAGARREISSALSIRFILFGLMAPFAAALLNRYGLRNVALIGAADRGLGAGRLAGDDKSLALDAAVGRRDRHRHRHDRAGAGRHHRHALVRGAARPRGRHPDRERRHRATGVPAAAGKPHRTYGWRVALALVCVMLGVAALRCCW